MYKYKMIYDWDFIAKKLCNEYGESIIDEGEEVNPYDWWLQDVTVADIIEFFKKNLEYNEIINTEPEIDPTKVIIVEPVYVKDI